MRTSDPSWIWYSRGMRIGETDLEILEGDITCYSSVLPCVVCAKMLINANVTRIVYEAEYPD